jgi:hypothetical protein
MINGGSHACRNSIRVQRPGVDANREIFEKIFGGFPQ